MERAQGVSDFFIGELRLFGFGYPPVDWAQCDGQTLPLAQNQALYSLLGIQFGGDAKTTFNLPDLRGRVALADSWGTPLPAGVTPGAHYATGNKGGAETVVLTQATVPSHSHSVGASSTPGTIANPANAYFADAAGALTTYGVGGTTVGLDPASVSVAGAGQGHANSQPSLVLNYCIALRGLYPPRG
ncbi:phage tail protein [Rhodospirillum rubrum]|nr:tail fiber protein [Rhodospirillum rubrum]MBK1665246.1 phage tail protein [Rhodospirillum rubrum]MBK1678163.1 phage tail protein [Rhodospirillum rubrum]